MDDKDLAYMEQMFTTIQNLNAEIQNERNATRPGYSVEDELDYGHPTGDGTGANWIPIELDKDDELLYNVASGMVSAAPVGPIQGKPRPRGPSPTPPRKSSSNTAFIPKDQAELCAVLGKNAELRIRAKAMEKDVEQTYQELEQSQRDIRMAERKLQNRDEKLRILLREKLMWQKELKEIRDQVVEEKMKQVEAYRRLENTKREYAGQLAEMEQSLREANLEAHALRAQVVDSKNQLAIQAKKMDELSKQSREEQERLVACIAETRQKFRDWKENESTSLKAARDQAIHKLKTEYELKLARHHEEKQKLRDKVKDLEVSLRLMQKDRSLSPLELSLRKAMILSNKDGAGTIEAELIDAHARIKELETLLDHSQDYQRRQENIIKVSEATISRLVQEREIAALENLTNQPLSGT
ncbi:TPA: hypothetical protein N0F65_002786, partial [Lagenidium giganteum]